MTSLPDDRQLDLAWCAGFIDGEGCFSVLMNRNTTGNKPARVGLSVQQVAREPLDRLQGVLGGKVRGPYQHRTGIGRKPYFRYDLRWGILQDVIEELWPYLSKPKRMQYNLAVDRVNSSLIKC